jgi:hypothetical protein
VAAKEPWCRNAKVLTEIAIFSPEAIGTHDAQVDTALNGAMRMLIEGHHQFDIIDQQADWPAYSVLVFPDKIRFDNALRAKLHEYLECGGSALFSHRSGMNENGAFIPEVPVTYEGEARYSPDYLMPETTLAEGIAKTPHVMYTGAIQARPDDDAERLAEIWRPYFNRSWQHFCSHNQTPPETGTGKAAIVRKDNVAWFAHPLFDLYMRKGPRVYRQLFLNALRLLLPEPLVEADAPSALRITLHEQPEENRHVLHLLHYIPEQRCRDIQTVEDVLPVYNIPVRLRLSQARRVSTAPEGRDLPFEVQNSHVTFTVPVIEGHQMVVIEA